MPERRKVVIQRMPGMECEPAMYFVRPGRRSGRWIWFKPQEVPPFEGRAASMEIERHEQGWRIIGPA